MAKTGDSPVITQMRMVRVAGRHSMLLNLCGAHAPFFTRNLVLLHDSAGDTGVGKVPGGDGILRALLACLFYIGDRTKTDLPYLASGKGWYAMRHQRAMMAEAIVDQAAAVERYGLSDFKLQGGVMRGEHEIEAAAAVKRRFADSRVTLDPNGAWSLAQAIASCKERGDVLAYAEDPCGPEDGYSGRPGHLTVDPLQTRGGAVAVPGRAGLGTDPTWTASRPRTGCTGRWPARRATMRWPCATAFPTSSTTPKQPSYER